MHPVWVCVRWPCAHSMPVHPETTSLLLAPARIQDQQGHIPPSSLCFGRSGACPRWRPTLWPVGGGHRHHTAVPLAARAGSCQGLGGQEAGKGSGTACRVRAPLTISMGTQWSTDLSTQRSLRSEHPLSPTPSAPARVWGGGSTSFLSCIPCSSILGPPGALLPGAARAGSGPPSGPPQA